MRERLKLKTKRSKPHGFRKNKIAIIRSNPISFDPRVTKIALSLSKRYEVLILGWDRECYYAPREMISNSVLIKRFRRKAPYGRISLALFLPVYQAWVLLNLLAYSPNIVHACDLDGAIPSYIFKMILRRKMLFDVFDRYCWVYLHSKMKRIYPFIKIFEEAIASKSDYLITVSKGALDTFVLQPSSRAVIPNYPVDSRITKKRCSSATDNIFKVVFTGGIRSDRGLLQVCKAIESLKNVKLIVAGKIIEWNFFKHISSLPNVEYRGLLPYRKALELQATADVIPVFVDPSLPTFHTVNPNKLFEAMMLSVPVITNVVTEVSRFGCGIVTSYGDINGIRNAILYLKSHPELRIRMGSKGRAAFEHKYNWKSTERKLFQIYDELLKNHA